MIRKNNSNNHLPTSVIHTSIIQTSVNLHGSTLLNPVYSGNSCPDLKSNTVIITWFAENVQTITQDAVNVHRNKINSASLSLYFPHLLICSHTSEELDSLALFNSLQQSQMEGSVSNERQIKPSSPLLFVKVLISCQQNVSTSIIQKELDNRWRQRSTSPKEKSYRAV